jgi:hypothetical protein
MSQEDSLKRIDLLIRALSQSKQSAIAGMSPEDISSLRGGIDADDRTRVIDLLEDLAVLLRDDPGNKGKIRTDTNKIMNGFGHIKPISDAINSVKAGFLS